MPTHRSRRIILTTLVSAGFAGCLRGGSEAPGDESGGDLGSNTDDETDTPDTEDGGETTATDGEGSDDDGSDEGTGDESPGEQVSRLPESHPLSDELVDLILAEDRQSFAETHDLAYQDGAVQVEIRLVEGGESPEQYLPEDRSEYGDTVIAYVNVDNLVDLALNDDIRRIFRRFPDEPG